MDPLSALGLAAAIVQFVQFGLDVAKRLDELNTHAQNPNDVPRSVQAVTLHLPLLVNSLKRIETEERIKKLDFDTKCILKGIVAGCQAQVQQIEAMIKEILCAPGDSFKSKMKKVFTSMRYDEKMAKVERHLQTYISVLILHHVVDLQEVPPERSEDAFFDVREKLVTDALQRQRLIQELDEYFHIAAHSQTDIPVMVFLTGKKGVGKTQLAVQYCHEAYKAGHFRAVFWVDASTVENLYRGVESIYATIKHSTDGSRRDKVAFVRTFLAGLWHPWLLVLDKYDADSMYDEIMDVIPTHGCGGILFTSREIRKGLGQIVPVPRFLTQDEQERVDILLRIAVEDKDEKAALAALDDGASIETEIVRGWPCINRVAMFGMQDTLCSLLQRGARMNSYSNCGTPLYSAAEYGGEACSRLLLDHEDKTEVLLSPDDYNGAIIGAARGGNVEILRMLKERRGCSLTKRGSDWQRKTPLDIAFSAGHVDLVKYLIKDGQVLKDAEQGERGLVIAAENEHVELVNFLCSTGIDVNTPTQENATPLIHACKIRGDEAKSMQLVKILLEKGADPNITRDTYGPLHEAVSHGYIEVIKLLLAHKADPTIEAAGHSTLTSCTNSSSAEIAALLLNVDIPESSARSMWLNKSLSEASRNGNRALVVQLLGAGADIDTRQVDGKTPLLVAAIHGQVQTAQFLIRRKARLDIADEDGLVPLWAAVRGGHELLVRDMIRAGGDVNMRNGEHDDTLLHLATGKGNDKMVVVLLNNGADKELENAFGERALEVAEANGVEKVISLLE